MPEGGASKYGNLENGLKPVSDELGRPEDDFNQLRASEKPFELLHDIKLVPLMFQYAFSTRNMFHKSLGLCDDVFAVGMLLLDDARPSERYCLILRDDVLVVGIAVVN